MSAGVKADRLAKSMVHHQTIVGENDDDAWTQAEIMAGRNPMINRSADSRSLRWLGQDAASGKQGLSEQEAKNSKFVQSRIVAGGPETVAAKLQAHADGGVQQVHTRFTVGAFNPDAWDRSLRVFVDEVMPRIDARTFDALCDDEVQLRALAGPLPSGSAPPAGYENQSRTQRHP